MRARQLGISDRVTFIYGEPSCAGLEVLKSTDADVLASSMNGIDLLKHFSSDTFDGVYAIESLQASFLLNRVRMINRRDK